MATRIKLRRGTSLQWSSANPVLSLGEFGYESNSTRFKIGNGTSSWNELPYNEQVITLTGDASGSGNGLIQVTVHDDSHNHTLSTIVGFAESVQDTIGDMVTGNTENGISVTYDDPTGKLNFNVNDPVITISGDVSGSATMTNLGDTNISVTVQPNSVDLGTDTVGDYVSTIGGTTNQVVVSGSGTEGRAVTLSLPQNINNTADVSFNSVTLANAKEGSATVTVVANDTPTVLDQFNTSAITTAEYVVQMKQNTRMTSLKALVVWDGTDVHFNQYSIIDASSGSAQATLSVVESSGVISLKISSPDALANNVVVKTAATYIKT
jgi:hypothetical protein